MGKINLDKAETSFYNPEDYGGRQSTLFLEALDISITSKKEIFSDSNSDDIPFLQDLTRQSFKNLGFVEFESWDDTETISARILDINSTSVVCECVLDKEDMVFQNRAFSKSLFSHLDLKITQFITIRIRVKAGSMRIDVFDGEKIVDKSLFETEELWKGKDYSKLTQPFKGKNA